MTVKFRQFSVCHLKARRARPHRGEDRGLHAVQLDELIHLFLRSLRVCLRHGYAVVTSNATAILNNVSSLPFIPYI